LKCVGCTSFFALVCSFALGECLTCSAFWTRRVNGVRTVFWRGDRPKSLRKISRAQVSFPLCPIEGLTIREPILTRHSLRCRHSLLKFPFRYQEWNCCGTGSKTGLELLFVRLRGSSPYTASAVYYAGQQIRCPVPVQSTGSQHLPLRGRERIRGIGFQPVIPPGCPEKR
jgi:hypothetical protein